MYIFIVLIQYNLKFLMGIDQSLLYKACKNNQGVGIKNMIKQIDKYDTKLISNKTGNDLLMFLVINKATNIILQLLDATDTLSFNRINNNGESPLMLACIHKLPSVALKLLENDTLSVGTINNQGNTALILACENNLPMVAQKLLENEEFRSTCKISQINKARECALQIACINGLNGIAMIMLEHKDKSYLRHIDNYGNTLLMIAIRNNLCIVAHRLLEFRDLIDLSMINGTGNTALSMAISNKMTDVALELLQTPDECNLSHMLFGNCNILLHACQHKMQEVALEILKQPKYYDIYQPNSVGCSAVDFAVDNKLKKVIDTIDIISSAQGRLDNNNIQYRINNQKCLICGGNTREFIEFSKCCHVIPCCCECTNHLPGKWCVLCRSQENKIKRVYVTL